MANFRLTRDQLATFLKNQEQIRAFESLFTAADVASPDTIETIQNSIDTAQASANSALAQAQYLIDHDGQTTRMEVKNFTPTLIPKGTAVGFAGVDSSNLIMVAPYLADGNTDSLYFVGCAAQDISGYSPGLVTLYGRITRIDTSGIPFGEPGRLAICSGRRRLRPGG